jgi:hypothetical protein
LGGFAGDDKEPKVTAEQMEISRRHSTLGHLSPMQYEQRWYEAQRKKAA